VHPHHDDDKDKSSSGSGDTSVCASDDDIEAATARWTILASEAGEVPKMRMPLMFEAPLFIARSFAYDL
jgi:hypothetical protein